MALLGSLREIDEVAVSHYLNISVSPLQATWTNMPSAPTLWVGTAAHITRVDLTNFTQCRLVVTKLATAGASPSKLMLKYSTSYTTTVGSLSDIGASEVSVATNVQNTNVATAWINLAAGAKADVFVSVVGSGGDGVLDPVFGQICAQFK